MPKQQTPPKSVPKGLPPQTYTKLAALGVSLLLLGFVGYIILFAADDWPTYKVVLTTVVLLTGVALLSWFIPGAIRIQANQSEQSTQDSQNPSGPHKLVSSGGFALLVFLIPAILTHLKPSSDVSTRGCP